MEYDLIALGLRLRQLGTDALSWRDLHVVCRQSPRVSALFRSMAPEEAPWGVSEHLLAEAVYAIRMGNWMQTEDAAKRRSHTRPKPIPRPGVKDDTAEQKTFGKGDAVPVGAMQSWLDDIHNGKVS